MAPRQPRKPVTMTMAPIAMTRLAAESDGKEGEKVAKLPWDTDSQMPTPSSPQPHNCKARDQKRGNQVSQVGNTHHKEISVQDELESAEIMPSNASTVSLHVRNEQAYSHITQSVIFPEKMCIFIVFTKYKSKGPCKYPSERLCW